MLADNSVIVRMGDSLGMYFMFAVSLELNVANGFVDRIHPILFPPLQLWTYRADILR